MIKRPVSTADIKPDDFACIKKKWKHYLVGDETNRTDNPAVQQLLQTITDKANQSQSIMNRSADACVLFGDKPIETTHEMGEQYRHLWNMAQAYGTFGTALYRNAQLKEDILYAIEWLYCHYYGMAEIDGTGWRSVFLFNWWEWYVQVPGFLCDTMIVLGDELPRSAVYKYLMPFDYIRTVSRTGKERPYASTRSYVVTEAAVLKEDPLLMLQCLEDLDLLLQPGEDVFNGGVMKDYSYLNHGPHAMEGVYGTAILIDRLILTNSILSGTKFEVNSEEVYNPFLWLEHTFRPILFNGVIFTGFCGRSPDCGIFSGREVIMGALYLLGNFGEKEDRTLKELIRQNVPPQNVNDVIITLNSIPLAQRLLAVLEEDMGIPVYERGMMRYKADRAVQHRAGVHGNRYAVSLNMSSTRIGRYECINHNNMEGWYQGDGTLYIYTNLTDGLQDEFGAAFFNQASPTSPLPYANMHRLPGTTEDTRKREPASIQRYIMGDRDFVGGAEMDGKYIAAAMDFVAYHHEEPDIQEDVGVGGGYPQIFSDLSARKSWFMFDDEVVAVGSAIRTTNEYPVNTYIDNRALFLSADANAAAITVDGRLCRSDDLHTESVLQPSWVHLGSFGGYCLPAGGDAVLHVTEGERQFFELWLAHGTKPQNAAYAYVMLPGRTAEETAAYSADPDTEIAVCTEKLHVVREKKLGITAMVFWEAGTYGGITADAPCIVMCKEDCGEWQITAAEPTQKVSTVRLTIDKTLCVKTADPRIMVTSGHTDGALLTFDFSDAEGETICGTFSVSDR